MGRSRHSKHVEQQRGTAALTRLDCCTRRGGIGACCRAEVVIGDAARGAAGRCVGGTLPAPAAGLVIIVVVALMFIVICRCD